MIRLPFAAALLGLAAAAGAQPPTSTPAATAGIPFDQWAAHARERLMALDTNHDGKISKDEFAARAGMMKHRGMGQPGADDAHAGMMTQHGADAGGDAGKAMPKHDGSHMFARFDTNNDGSLTPGEIRKYHEAQMAKAKAPADDMAADDDAAPAPPPADADAGQPAPPQDEANRGPGRHGMRGPGMIRELMIMQRIDTDENGQISKQEAEAAFDKFFTRMDTNKDGVISIADMPQRPFL